MIDKLVLDVNLLNNKALIGRVIEFALMLYCIFPSSLTCHRRRIESNDATRGNKDKKDNCSTRSQLEFTYSY